MLIIPPVRGTDQHGSGNFGAPRGGRTHKGIDLNCAPGSQLLCPLRGIITKFGYPYGDDLTYRYVEITNDDDLRFRYFYVEPSPSLSIGDDTHHNMVLGVVQDLTRRYPGISNHIHHEIKDHSGNYIDPTNFI